MQNFLVAYSTYLSFSIDLVTKRYVLNEGESKVVLEIFSLYLYDNYYRK